MDTLTKQSLLCQELIGRGEHLELIERLLDEVDAGRHQTLLISGEEGMGKSRLVAEICRRCESRSWHILSGQCTQIEQGMPYAAVLDALRSFDASGLPVEPAQPLVRRVSELVSLLSKSGFRSLPAPRSVLDRYHLYQAVTELIDELSDSGPLLLVFEDLHWADDTTLELLPYIAQHIVSQPVFLILTYRADEVGRPLTRLLVQMDRTRHVSELHLAPLSRGEVDLMLRAVFGQSRPVRAPFLDALYTLTEGNPFFVEESLKSMVMAGELVLTDDGVWTDRPLGECHIPRSVEDAVQQRSERVSEAARTLLKLAAVAGRRFAFTLLQRLMDLQEEELLDLLRELIDAQFLEEESADRLRFRHTLTRQCIYATVMVRERRRLHAAIAAELELLHSDQPDRHVVDLAYHSYMGECWQQALKYTELAGETALALCAPQTAVEQFDRAIESAQHFAQAPRHRLHWQRGQAHALLGDFDAARRDYEEALDGASAAEDTQAEWTTLVDLGQLWVTRDYARGGEYMTQALTVAQNVGLPALIAQSRNAMGNWEMNQGRPADAVQNHQQALAMFRSTNDVQGIAQSLDLLAIASYNCGDVIGGRNHYLEALPIWRKLGDRRGLLHTLSGLGLAADFDLEVNDCPVSQHVGWAEEGVAVARDLGWRSGIVLTLNCSALAKRHQGLYGAALDLLHEALALAEEIDHREWIVNAQVSIGAVLLDMLAVDEARPYLEQALAMAREINSMIWIAYASKELASMHTLRGDFTQAEVVLDAVLPPDMHTATLQCRGLWFARAELALASSRPMEALEISSCLVATRPDIETATAGATLADQPAKIVPRLGLLRSRALLALDRKEEAADLVDSCVLAATNQQRKRLLWRLYAAQAETCLVRHEADAAEKALASARQTIEAMATSVRASSTADAHQLAEQFMLRASATMPHAAQHGGGARHLANGNGLTPREQEVAELVAQGQTNRAIADMLFLSERTAERHVANIMNKLGHNSRSQIAAWYVARQMSPTDYGQRN